MQYELKFSNVKIIVLSNIIKLLDDTEIDENDVLKKYGKYKYQSLKKIYGLYYLFNYGYDNIIIFDSETFFIREIDVDHFINKYISKPFIVRSLKPIKNNKLHNDVDNSAREILNIEYYIGWLLEYYLWIYEKRIFCDMMKYIINKYEKTFYQLFEPYQNIFIEVLFQLYICKNNDKYKYKIIEFEKYIENKYVQNSSEIMKIFDSIIPLRPIEDSRMLIENNYDNLIYNLYNDNKFILMKINDTQKLLHFIINNENIKICVSEYSEIIFNNFHKDYLYDIINNHNFINRNVKLMNDINNEKIYNVLKKTNNHQDLLWLGYEMTFIHDVNIKFSFELLFNELKNTTKNNFIAFKRHNPYELNIISMQNIIIGKWQMYEFIIKCIRNVADLYIIIFDDAPECNVFIKNFNFQILE
jgi:hypothetical protein